MMSSLLCILLLSLAKASAAQHDEPLKRHLNLPPPPAEDDDNDPPPAIMSSGIVATSDMIKMDETPSSLASNASGDKIIVGSPYRFAIGGAVKIYKLVHDDRDDGDQTSCTQQQQESTDGLVDCSRSSSSSSWVEVSNILPGLEYFGFHVAMNHGGDRIAVGTFNEDGVGSVRVYGNYTCNEDDVNHDEECWEQIGDKILGGSKVAMDSTGLQIAIRESGGNTKVYSQSSNCTSTAPSTSSSTEFDSSTSSNHCWLQVGNDIPGLPSSYLTYGNPFAFAHNGMVVVIGDPGRREVIAYSYNEHECTTKNDTDTDTTNMNVNMSMNASEYCWTQLGDKISSDQFTDRFGQALALNEASDRMIIGAPFHDVDGIPNVGIAKVYELRRNTSTDDDDDDDGGAAACGGGNDHDHCWKQIGQTIIGDFQYDKLGLSVAMSRDGNSVAIGSPYADNDNAKNIGKVQFYEFMDAGTDNDNDNDNDTASSWKLIAERTFYTFDDEMQQRRGALHLAMNLDGDTIVSADGDYPGRIKQYRLHPCEDSPRRFILNGRPRSCAWVRQHGLGPDKIAMRCSKKSIATHCPASCGRCNASACKDSKMKFELWNGSIKSCAWVGQTESKIEQRCVKPYSGIARTCRSTCGLCLDT